MPLRHDNDIRATSLHFFSARQQPPNIDIQCLGPDWQRPARRDTTGMHTSHETVLWVEGEESEVAARHPDVSQMNSSVAQASREHSCDFSSFTQM